MDRKNVIMSLLLIMSLMLYACAPAQQTISNQQSSGSSQQEVVPEPVQEVSQDINDISSVEEDINVDELGDIDSLLQDLENI